jgi:hypothetical protein
MTPTQALLVALVNELSVEVGAVTITNQIIRRTVRTWDNNSLTTVFVPTKIVATSKRTFVHAVFVRKLVLINGYETVVFFSNDYFPINCVHVAKIRVLFDFDAAPQDVSQTRKADLLHALHLANDERIVL